MTVQNYLMVNKSTNVVENICVWDGDTNKWQPPANTIMLIQSQIPAMLWEINTDKTDYVLVEQMGVGAIGFTWDGAIVTTNKPKPIILAQPITTGIQTA